MPLIWTVYYEVRSRYRWYILKGMALAASTQSQAPPTNHTWLQWSVWLWTNTDTSILPFTQDQFATWSKLLETAHKLLPCYKVAICGVVEKSFLHPEREDESSVIQVVLRIKQLLSHISKGASFGDSTIWLVSLQGEVFRACPTEELSGPTQDK